MASWMVHLRIADRLFDVISELSYQDFIVGNLAPDSGVPNEDWSVFTPPVSVSHFQNAALRTGKKIDISAFTGKYFTEKLQESYTREEYSFYLGYLTHLLTDILWADTIFTPTMARFSDQGDAKRKRAIEKVKADWYDLDFLFLRKHPHFRAFQVYLGSVGYINHFMEEFSANAFENRRKYITEFYLEENPNLDREFPYLTEAEMDAFVETGASMIQKRLLKTYMISRRQ